jgi:hypothetical protein
MKRYFMICGLRPAQGKAVNDFLRAMDLGVLGAFIPFMGFATVVVKDDCTQAQLDGQPGAIKAAYEAMGHRNIEIVEVDE